MKRIFWIGLIAGTSDITENIIFNAFRQITPWRIFQYIASGLIGMRAFGIGWWSVWLGVIVHYAIAFTWTAIFCVAVLKSPSILRRLVLAGLIYGGIVYLIMTFVVVPHTGVPHPPAAVSIISRINAVFALMFCFGLPLSVLASRKLDPLCN